jgi:hypothetical protein
VRRLLFAMVIVGGVLIFLGVQEYRLSKVARAEPQTITCAGLAAAGPGDNAHVRLTEFEFTENYIYQEKKRSSEWKTSYVPAVPPRVKDVPNVRAIKVLIKSNRARNEDELWALSTGPIEGVIVNVIASLGSTERRLLKESYPEIDVDTCWILEAGKKPATTGSIMGMIGGGAGLSVVAAGFLLLAARKA